MVDGAPVNLLDYIPIAEHAAIRAKTSTYDCTSAINLALASQKSVYVPYGTYLTTGGHRIAYASQGINCEIGSTLKRSSGSTTILDTTHGCYRAQLTGLEFDCNNTDGLAILWRGHYGLVANIRVINGGGTSFVMRVSGSNVSTYRNIDLNGYSCLQIDQTADPYSPTPSYGNLYSTWDSLGLASAGGMAMQLKGSQCTALCFTNFRFAEGSSLLYPLVHITEGPIHAVYFRDFQFEYQELYHPLIKIDASAGGSAISKIVFDGGRMATGFTQTEPVFELDTVFGVTIKDILFSNSPSVAGRTLITIKDSKQISVLNNSVEQSAADFVFIEDLGGNNYITEQGNSSALDGINWPGTGTNIWDTSTNITIINSNMTQSFTTNPPTGYLNVNKLNMYTIADDGYYDISGTGGTTDGGDFVGVITIIPTDVDATAINNFATFYGQVGYQAGMTLNTAISVGSNVEVLNNAYGTPAALATTTDGKLGVQLGNNFVSSQARYVRVYNRTGATLNIVISVQNHKLT